MQTLVIDKTHSETAFQVRHLVTKVRGRFTDFEGRATIYGGSAIVTNGALHDDILGVLRAG